MTPSDEVLRRLTIGDRAFRNALVAGCRPQGSLDERSLAMLRLGATISMGSSGTIWHQRVADALDNGYTTDEVVESLTALAPLIGIDRLVEAAPELARAIGYDVDDALERLES
jgi:4-carboxymuconolactone decarboxylase